MVTIVRAATRADVAGFRYVGFATWPQTYQPIAEAAYVVEHLDEYWSEQALLPAIEAGDAVVAVDGDEIVGVSEVADRGDDLVIGGSPRCASGRGKASALDSWRRSFNSLRTDIACS